MEVTPLIAYLSGGMENAQNEGADWRSDMTNWLKVNLFWVIANTKILKWKLRH